MPTLPFTLRQLEVFASLSATGSFRRSADLLGISQASVSSQIRTLEEQLGVLLFARRPGRNSTLTAHGVRFLEDYEGFASAAARLARHRRAPAHHDDPIVIRVRIGQGLFDGYIRPQLGPFLAANRAIELEFDPQPPISTIAEEVLDGRTHLGLFHIPEQMDVPAYLRSIAVVRGGVYGHASFARGKTLPLEPDEVSHLPFIVATAGSAMEKTMLASLKAHGIVPRHVVGHSQYYDVIATLLEKGIGLATFSEAVLPRHMRETVILLHPLHDWRLVLFSNNRDADPRIDLLEQFLLSCVIDNEDYPGI